MATDTKRTGLHNQKRGVCVMVSEELGSTTTEGVAVVSTGSTIATLPDKSMIISVRILVTAASAASDDLAVDYAGSALEASILVDALGMITGTPITTAAYSATGGDVVVKNGAQVVDTTFRGRAIIEYIELDKVTGEYTA